jgi:endonuclease/exonuclease/phosphatase family metal-dependent hydrolase
MTTRALPRAAVVAELALPALTVAFGLQLLRLMVSTAVSVYRERLGASLGSLALVAVGTILLGLFAWPVVRRLGRRRVLGLTAGGVALIRLVLQLVPDAVLRWLLAPVGVVLFLWFVPAWLDRAGTGAGFGLALLVGLAIDTALQGLHASWDYAWSVTLWPMVQAATLSTAALLALAALLRSGDGAVAPAKPPVAVLALAGIGPALFLQAMVWQNLGWLAVHAGRPQTQVFLLVMLANLAALAAGAAATRTPVPGWPVTVTAVAGLVVAVVLAERATVASTVLGQAAAAVLLVAITRGAVGPDGRQGSADPGLGRTAVALTLGMLLFTLLVFFYYAAYETALPFDNGVLPLVAAALLALAGLAAVRSGGPQPSWPGSVAVWVGVALLLAPAAFWASAPGPVGAEPDRGERSGPMVRVMSYNLHFGFDVEGWSDLEATARTIEASGAEVVGLQEVSRGWYVNGSADMLAWLQRRLRMPHVRFAGASDASWGNAVLSRFPIVADGVVPLPREGTLLRRNFLWAELDLGARRRLRVVVTHLHHVEGPVGAAVRLVQLPPLLQGVAGRSTTVLLGDLNAEPDSPEIALLRAADLVDAFQAGAGTASDERTYASDRPERRIDYIWLSPDLRASGFDATTGTASDHRGVMATIRPAG